MRPDRSAARGPLVALLLAGAFALGGCATRGEARNPRDPYEPFNRHVYEFNEGLDRILLKPTATLYRDKVPPLMRTGVSNFFSNLSDGWSAVNSLLQFRLQEAEESLARFHVNTMFGVFGIFDVASELNLERHNEDFGQTLGRWGVPAGPFLMLPLFGPSTMRDALALPVDRRFDPLRLFDPGGARDMGYALRVVDKRSNLLRVGNVLEEASLDKYSFTREAYLQRRRAQIFDHEEGRDVPPPLPDESRTPAAAPAAAPAPAAPGRPPAR